MPEPDRPTSAGGAGSGPDSSDGSSPLSGGGSRGGNDDTVAEGTDSGGSPSGGSRRAGQALAKRLLASRMVRYGFVVLVVGYGAYAVSKQWTDIHHAVGRIGLPMSLAALVFVLAALFTSMLSWRALLTGLGSPLPVPVAARIFFVGQLGKYLPGSVWPVLAQMEIATAHKVPRHRTAGASVLTMLVSLLTGLIIAIIALPLSGGSTPYEWAFIAAPFLLACLYPKVLNWGFSRLLRLAKRPPLDHSLGGRAIAISLAWSFVSWMCYGFQIWVLVIRVGAPAGKALPLAIGAFAFAWCAGFLVILAPAGAGVREVIMVAILGPVVGSGPATAIALVSRAVTAVADLVVAGVATAYLRHDRCRRSAGPEGTSPLGSPVQSADGNRGSEVPAVTSRARRG
jgi:glycosyltransferase 2 family protein